MTSLDPLYDSVQRHTVALAVTLPADQLAELIVMARTRGLTLDDLVAELLEASIDE